MAATDLPATSFLRKFLECDPLTGCLTWLPRDREHFKTDRKWKGWNTCHANKEAFTAEDSNGYRFGSLFGVQYRTHRVIWKMVNGHDPQMIDHVNGVRTDNRICNLREVTSIENSRNIGLYHSTESGVMGVVWYPRYEKWVARISVNRKRICLGYYDEIEDAIAARRQAEAEHGFHAGHGQRDAYLKRDTPITPKMDTIIAPAHWSSGCGKAAMDQD